MLPSVPKSLGRLSDAYLSAYLALTSASNPLKLPVKKSYLVILVDGLGSHNIKSAAGHAPFLNRKLATSKSIFAGFPSTTTSSLTSLATGVPNGTHAVIGHRVYDRRIEQNINYLHDLGVELEPRDYQTLETISERASSQGVSVSTIGPAEYDRSGFTMATMPNSVYVAARDFSDGFAKALKILSTPKTLTYLYFPELDKIAHRFGTSSTRWLNALEELDAELAKFSRSIPSTAGVVLTADHGVIDVPVERHVYLDEYDCFDDLEQIGGDPRVGFLYFPTETNLVEKILQIRQALWNMCDVVTMTDLVVSGWLSRLSESAELVAPDLVILPKSDRVVFHRKFSKARSLLLIGQHGGMSQAEWEVPLLVF